MNGLANENILENQIMFHVVKHTDFRTSERSISRDKFHEYISNVANSAPLYFEPAVTEMTVQVGKPYNTHYVMKNKSNKQLHTTASPSVTPGKYAEYFKKIECFMIFLTHF